METDIGTLVRSVSGRDKDRILMIVENVDENYVKVADGSLRKKENPKLKKLKHLKPIVDENDVCVKNFPERLTNRTIRDIIGRYEKTNTINQDEKE